MPATSANIGPGFDCLGLAVELDLSIDVEPSEEFCIENTGEGAGVLPADESNLIVAFSTGLSPTWD